MLSYQLQLEVPIPSQSTSTRPLSCLGGHSGQQGTLSTPGNSFGNFLDGSQKGRWTGQNTPTNADLYTLSVPQMPSLQPIL